MKTTPAHTHLFDKKNVADKYRKSAADCTHPAVYYFSCACGEVGTQTFEDGTALGHNFGAGNVTTQPTCTSQGIMTYTCTRCGMTKTEAIPARGHTYVANGKVIRFVAAKPTLFLTHKYSELLKKAATFTTPAEYQLVCSCGEIGSQTYTKGEALGHKPEKIEGKAATCTEKGLTDGEKCSVCGTILVEQKEIPALGHNPEKIEGKAATCTEKGLTDGEKCSRCGVVLKAQEEIAIDPKNHVSYGDWRHVSYADFFDKKMSFGIAERQCAACGEYEDIYINASIELPEGAKCGTKVKVKYKCLFEVRADGSIVEGGHACGQEWTEEVYLTHHYDENGLCVICGEKKKQ